MSRYIFYFFYGLFISTSAPAWTANTVSVNELPALLERGRTVYELNCAGCHGASGNGEGPAAYGLHPKPRDFTRGIFKFRTTPSGSLPTEDDLFRTIRGGVNYTSMPAFQFMPEADVRAVIEYIKSFSDAWENKYMHEFPVVLENPPRWFTKPLKKKQEYVESGRVLFQNFCVSCHGKTGRGDGPAMPTLKDDWGHAIKPADLRKPGIKRGRSIYEVYRTLKTGLNGVAMPSYSDSATDEELWQVVTYVQHMRDAYHKSQPSRTML